MVAMRTLTRTAVVVLIGAGTLVWYACTDRTADSPTGPAAAPRPGVRWAAPDLRMAMMAQQRHTEALLEIPGVVGTAVTGLPDGRAAMLILLERPDVPGLPPVLDGVPVTLRVSGRLMAFSDPTQRQRPAPAGFSVGHPAVTAGTIGARVRDALGRVYILSNNHVLANSNNASIGDAAYQPGPFDGGSAADQIATLSDFETITFTSTANNTIDAAIALSSVTLLDNAVPSDDGYGMPNATIYGDADGDGVFDDPNALLGLNVQKYGRTTRLTHGQITGVNATVTVCYAVSGFSCTQAARFEDQLIISPGTFSGGGDSGSLIVTDDANLNPVALLFAGSSTVTIANRIDLVLNRFGVSIDGFAPPPPGPVTDVAVTTLSGPSAAVQGATADITVTVKNVGNQDVSTVQVTLQDTTEHVTVGTQSVAGLAAGATATLTFVWTPADTGDHHLVASQTLADDKATNDQRSVRIPVNPPVTDVAVTSINTPSSVILGHTVDIGVTVTNVGNQSVTSSFTVTLTDATAGVTLGTQTVAGLDVGATATRSFSWNTANAALGAHTLVATHTLSDDDAANNQRSVPVTVTPPPTDLALTAISAPTQVAQGDTAHVVVTIQNVGEVDVDTAFAVVLSDATADWATIGIDTVSGLAVGATTTVEFPWNTAGAFLNGHILIATQLLADANASNNSVAVIIDVTAPVPPPTATDVAVTGVSAPAAVTQGSPATIDVTVQNVGQQPVSTSFDIILTDATAGVTLDTQTVVGLDVGAVATRSFSWSTANAALGGHTLVAAHTLSDDNAANDQRSVPVTVTPPAIDLALTGISAPAQVAQGDTAHVVVTVQNVGGVDVDTFAIVLSDATADWATIGIETVSGLAVGATTTVEFPWNTAGAFLNGHILNATQLLADANASNNSVAVIIDVTAPVPPPTATDVAVTGMSAPTAVTQGSPATIDVTVQNVGQQNVSTGFDIILTDATAGVTLGTQTVVGLDVGATATRSFSWNTANAALGGHTLVAAHTASDDNAANDQRSVPVTVTLPPTDLALTGISGPAQVTQGDTAHVVVTIQNVGGMDVGTAFDIVLTDGTAGGVTIGTQTVPGLAVGATTTVDFPWNTAGVAAAGHILVATQLLTDANASNNSAAITIDVNPPSMHVGNLEGAAARSGNTWTVTVEITVHDASHAPLNGVTVHGTWNGSSSAEAECSTNGTGTCSVVLSSISRSIRTVSFAVTTMTRVGYAYQSSANHDPDGNSNGFSIFVRR